MSSSLPPPPPAIPGLVTSTLSVPAFLLLLPSGELKSTHTQVTGDPNTKPSIQ